MAKDMKQLEKELAFAHFCKILVGDIFERLNVPKNNAAWTLRNWTHLLGGKLFVVILQIFFGSLTFRINVFDSSEIVLSYPDDSMASHFHLAEQDCVDNIVKAIELKLKQLTSKI